MSVRYLQTCVPYPAFPSEARGDGRHKGKPRSPMLLAGTLCHDNVGGTVAMAVRRPSGAAGTRHLNSGLIRFKIGQAVKPHDDPISDLFLATQQVNTTRLTVTHPHFFDIQA